MSHAKQYICRKMLSTARIYRMYPLVKDLPVDSAIFVQLATGKMTHDWQGEIVPY